MNRTRSLAAVAVAVFGALGLGYWWGRSHDRADATSAATAPAAERKALYWYDPMVPDQHFDKPGKSPFMDMQMVPKYADEAGADGVAIAPGVRQNLGIRTVEVKRGRLDNAINVPGTIGWDLRLERVVSARVDSIVERLHVRAPFEPVRAGQPLVNLIAPGWSTAVAESSALAGAQSSAARELQSAARERLHALGLPAGSGTRNGQVTLVAPLAGVVSEIGVREGQSAPMGTLLFRVNGTRTVWLEAEIPQAITAGIRAGTPVEATVDAWPGERFRGRVESLLPQIDPATRAQRARIVLENPQGALAPGMFAQVSLQPAAEMEHPLVPTDALIGAGAQARVIVLGADDTFQPVRVRTGRSSDGMTEILAGLKGGERVVASGQFLIDSEASLSGALERLNGEAVAPPAAMNDDAQMSGEVMPGMPEMAAPPSKPVTPKRTQPAIQPASPARQCPVAYWYDPMKPDAHFDKPGKSPFMDMQLVPKFAAGANADCTIRDVPVAGAQP